MAGAAPVRGVWVLWKELSAAVELALPMVCAGCGAGDTAGEDLCPACDREVVRWARDPLGPVFAPLALWAAAPYASAVRNVVVAHKDRGRTRLQPVLTRLWRSALLTALTDPQWQAPLDRARERGRLAVVPIASSAVARRRRGAEPWGAVVADGLRGTGVPCLPFLRTGRVVDQAGLDRDERRRNRTGATRALARVDGWTCVLADDVVTTGATLADAQAELHRAGAETVVAVVVASTPLRSQIETIGSAVTAR